jgi:hypothetical protein
MKERIKGAFTKKKIFHFLKMALFVVALSLILLSLLGTVAHATGLVDDTINAENLYSKYPLSNYQLDFYVDNSWSWLPWNWLDGIGKSVQYGLYCITNFVWTISLYLSNATGYVVQEAYKLDFINDMADSIGKSIQTLAGVTENGFSSSGFYVGFLLLIILVVGMYVAYTGLIKRETSKAIHAVINFVVVFVLSASFIAYAPDYIMPVSKNTNIVIPKLKNSRKNTMPKRFTTCGIVRLLLSLSSISVFTTSSLVFPSSSSGLADTRASTRSVPISSALLFPNCKSSHGCST